MHTKKSGHLVFITSALCLSLGLLGCPAVPEPSVPTPTPPPHVKSWGTAALIETDNAGSAQYPQIAIDASGNALTVWYQFDGTRNNIWANRYTPGTGWGTAALIETNLGDASDPQIAIDASGNAIAVWYQSDGTRENIWANRYALGTGWGTAALIETENSGGADSPQIAFDASGNALVIWSQSDGTRYNIWANRYIAGTGWGTAGLIENDTGNAGDPQIAIDAWGNAIAVWTQSDGTCNNIWANRYALGTGWGTAALIETDNSGSASIPQIASDVSGNALAVWAQWDGTRDNIWANRYALGTGWGTAALIETDNSGDAYFPQITFDVLGNAIAVWNQSDGTQYNIWAKRFALGTGWGTAALIETDNSGNAGNPQLAMDTSGNAIAVWYQYDGTRTNIWANRYVAVTGWGTAGLIETDNSGSAQYPQIAIDATGNAIAVWSQSDGTRDNICANSYR